MRPWTILFVSCVAQMVVSLGGQAAVRYLDPEEIQAELASPPPDPFYFAPKGQMKPPAAPVLDVPANQPWLSVFRPYAVHHATPEPWSAPLLPLEVPNPFLPRSQEVPVPALPPNVSTAILGDWHHYWSIETIGDPWNAATHAWRVDAIALRRRFRESAGIDWPVTPNTGMAGRAALFLVERWIRSAWRDSLQQTLAAIRQQYSIRGLFVLEEAWNTILTSPDAGLVDHPELILRPRVTGDASVNRYGIAFQVRLAADLGRRIPLPKLDVAGLSKGEEDWIPGWIDACVQEGVAGIIVRPPENESGRAVLRRHLAPLASANLFLPPPAETGILVSTSTATLEPFSWREVFRAFARLREAGLTADFVSDRQITSGAVPLARFRLLVIPAARWCDPAVLDRVGDWTARGGTLVITDTQAFDLDLQGKSLATRRQAILGRKPDEPSSWIEIAHGHGRILWATTPMPGQADIPDTFWRVLRREAGIPNRPWLEAIGAHNVHRVTGTRKQQGAGGPVLP